MAVFFFFLLLFSICLLIAGLIKPSIFARFVKFTPKRKTIALIFSVLSIFSLLMIGKFSPVAEQPNQQNNQIANQENTTTVKNEPEVQQTTTEAKSQPSNNTAVADSSTTSQYIYYSVVDVVDGDTIKINMDGTQETIRLIGIDTPETVDPRKPVQCFGKEASNKAKELLLGKKVRVEKDSTQGDRDKYGRLLAYIYREDGLFFNKYMIEQGYAHEYTYDTPYKYQAEFKEAEKYARENQLGLWSPSTCNGDTASGATSSGETATTTQTTGKYYTSSYATSKYYYPESCSGWQSLSPSYLKAFDSLEALLASYPSRTLSPQCQ